MTEEEIKYIIDFDIVVDAKDDEDIYMGWYYFMVETLEFPFKAIAIIKKRNGTTEERTVEVVEDATDAERFKCQAYYVNVDYEGVLMKVEIADLKPINASEETLKAITVWKYWKDKGYY
jgi:Calcium binding